MGLVWYLYLSDTPASHLDIDCLLTLHFDASSSCVIPFAFRNSIIFSDNFIKDYLLQLLILLYKIFIIFTTNFKVLFRNL